MVRLLEPFAVQHFGEPFGGEIAHSVMIRLDGCQRRRCVGAEHFVIIDTEDGDIPGNGDLHLVAGLQHLDCTVVKGGENRSRLWEPPDPVGQMRQIVALAPHAIAGDGKTGGADGFDEGLAAELAPCVPLEVADESVRPVDPLRQEVPRGVHSCFVRRSGNIDEICLPSAKDLLVVDVKGDGRDVQLGQFLRTVLGGRHRKDDAVDVAVGERGNELGRELLADADELEIPVELVFRDVAQESAELSASGFARESEGDDNALGPLMTHAGKYTKKWLNWTDVW